ncbi:MAG: TauD/TfdA family dioxygenase [Pseudomonadota bacterium]
MPVSVFPQTDRTFGATLNGIDINHVSDSDWSIVEAALNEYGLLIFPSQEISQEGVAAFARRFGPLEGDRPDALLKARPISNRRADQSIVESTDPIWLTLSYPTRYWHKDGTFNDIPPKICVLAGQLVTREHGQTQFADMAAAWDALNQEQQHRLQSMVAFHSNLIGSTRVLPPEHRKTLDALVGDEPVDGFYGLNYRAETPLRPLVHTHRETGRQSLFIGRHVFGIPDMTPEDSEQFLNDLVDEACQGERVIEHTWTPGDVLVWDNRRLLHRAMPYDEQHETRVLLNCRIVGDSGEKGLANELAARSVEMQHSELLRLRAR